MTYLTIPLSPVPAYNIDCTQAQRNGIYYEGQSVVITLSQATATDYEVRDYNGDVVDSGAVSGTTLTLGTFALGWYRLYLFGASSDSLFGDSYGATTFGVIPADANFPTLPTSVYNPSYGGYAPSGQGGIATFDDPVELITRACLGIPTSRLVVLNVAAPETGVPGGLGFTNRLSDVVNAVAVANDWWLNPTYADPVRTRRQWVAFPNQSVDRYDILNGTAALWVRIFPLTGLIDSENVYVEAVAASVSGVKINIYYPTNATLVASHDNLATKAAAVTAINAGAANTLVKAFETPLADGTPAVTAKAALGSDYRAGIILCVSTLYPLGVTHFEGARNEPILEPSAAHELYLFQDSVHAGHASAKAMGPASVNITADGSEGDGSSWDTFLSACDAIPFIPDCVSFHDYNTAVNGDLNQGRQNIEQFLGWLEDHGWENLERWQSEANSNPTSRFGVYHPRNSGRVTMLRILLWEQYGVPFERNPYWYDYSHGYFAVPTWLFTPAPNPQALTMATHGRETFGKDWHHHIDFGSVVANRVFIGNVYGDATTGSTAALMCASYMDSASVTLDVHGTTGDLVAVDAFGVETTATQTAGQVTLTLLDTPCYVRLPADVNVSVSSVNDWGASPSVSISSVAQSYTLGGVTAARIADEEFMDTYLGGTASDGIAYSAAGLPDTATVRFVVSKSIERVVVWCGPFWQDMPGLYAYTVDTLGLDGVTWTTRKTVSRSPGTSFLHGTHYTDSATRMETFDKEQWIEDVKLTSPVTCLGVRLSITDTSYGGEPDADRVTYGGFQMGQGQLVRNVALQEIAVFSPTTLAVPNAYATEVLADNPSGYWSFEETVGTTAVSNVNSPTLDGTYVNSPTLGVTGKVGLAMFGGVGATERYVTVPDNALFQFGDVFSITAWVKPNTLNPGVIGICDHGSAVDVNNHSWSFAAGGTSVLQLVRPFGGVFVATSSAALAADAWSHVAVTKSGAACHIYINGEDVTVAGTNATFSDAGFGQDLRIGEFYTTTDELAIYPTALSAARILALYLAGNYPDEPTITDVPVVEIGP